MDPLISIRHPHNAVYVRIGILHNLVQRLQMYLGRVQVGLLYENIDRRFAGSMLIILKVTIYIVQ
jgi:hypothetical protein